MVLLDTCSPDKLTNFVDRSSALHKTGRLAAWGWFVPDCHCQLHGYSQTVPSCLSL